MATFLAKFPGRCTECGKPIVAEQECTYSADDQIIHVDCDAADSESSQLVGKPCPRCFVTMPLTGGCDSCD